MVEMTSKERLCAALALRRPDRVPVSPNMVFWAAADCGGGFDWPRQLSLAERFGADAIVDVHFETPCYVREPRAGDYKDLEQVTVEVRVERGDGLDVYHRRFRTPAGDLTDCVAVGRHNSQYGLWPTPMAREFLVKGLRDVPKFRYLLPDPRKTPPPDWPGMIQTIGERGLLRVHLANGVGMTLMTTAMGMENAMTAFYDDRPTFDAMLNVCAEYCQKVIKRMLELGAPWIFVSWHDLGVSAGWSPTIWRNAFRTVIKASIDLVHEHGALYHYFDNGPIMPILAEVGELGPDSISSLCPPPVGDADLAEAKRLIGAKVCLIGNVDAIHVMQKGGPAEVRAAVLDAIEAGAPGGGFILGNSDAFFQGTPRENIDAFFAAAREFGRYDA